VQSLFFGFSNGVNSLEGSRSFGRDFCILERKL
jgi:hypothetical protein